MTNNVNPDSNSWDGTEPLSETFFDVASNVYRDLKYWIPESEVSIRQQFSNENPYFEKNKVWISIVENKARLAGFYDPSQRIEGESVAYFGFWETENNISINRSLFEEFETWAKRQGASVVYGPINFSTYHSNRVRLDAFDKSCFPGEPFNPSYYPELLSALGYGIRYRYYSNIAKLSDIVESQRPAFERVNRDLSGKVRIELLSEAFWLSRLDELYGFVDQVFGGNFGYRSIDKDTFYRVCGEGFSKKMCPRSSVVALDEDDKIAGFFLGFPDYGSLLCQGKKNSMVESDISYKHCYQQLEKPRVLLGKTGGVRPDFRSSGLFGAMTYMLQNFGNPHYDLACAALVREDNLSLKAASALNRSRTYALFFKSI